MAIDKTLIDQLLADCKKPEVIGEKGLLKRLTKTIPERVFQAGRARPGRELNCGCKYSRS
jgi:hypothetical protein